MIRCDVYKLSESESLCDSIFKGSDFCGLEGVAEVELAYRRIYQSTLGNGSDLRLNIEVGVAKESKSDAFTID